MIRIGVICPLDEEFLALIDAFDLNEEVEFDNAMVYRHRIAEAKGEVLFVMPSEKSDTAAAVVAAMLTAKFDLSALVSFGIAGAMGKECLLGDVCVSSSITDLIRGKRYRDSDGEASLSLSDNSVELPGNIKLAVRALDVDPTGVKKCDAWTKQCTQWKADHLGADPEGELAKLLEKKAISPEASWHFGRIGSFGGVVDDPVVKDRLVKRDPDLIAVETECAGIVAAARNAKVEALAIRGISDFADGTKKKVDEFGKGKIRAYAAHNAAALLKCLIGYDRFLTSFEKVGSIQNASQEVPAAEQIYGDIREALSERLPIGVNYMQGSLPVPKLQSTGGLPSDSENVPLFNNPAALNRRRSLDSALENEARVFINIDEARFDVSVPYMLADSLYSRKLHDKLCVTFVSHCENFKYYRGASSLQRLSLSADEQVFMTPVYLVYGLRPRHKPTENLLKFVGEHPEIKFVLFGEFLDRSGNPEAYVESYKAPFYKLGDPSVENISTFLERQLGYQSEVSSKHALMIRGAMQRLGIPISVGYLAKFTIENVGRFLEANSMLELAELFVGASLVDATDASRVSSRVRLSTATYRRLLGAITRERFLNSAVVPMAEVVDTAQVFSKQFDLGLSGDALLKALFDGGILVEIFGDVSFAVELVRLYFKAQILAESEADVLSFVRRYHQWTSSDLILLQIAVELGAPLAASLDFISSEVATSETRWRDDSMLPRFDASGFIADLIDFVEDEKSAASEKDDWKMVPEQIAFLEDMQDYSADARTAPKSTSVEVPEDLRGVSEYGRLRSTYLSICAMMLGSGAESLTGDQKERLANIVLQLSVECFNVWLYWCSEAPPSKRFDELVELELQRVSPEAKTEEFLQAVEFGKTVVSVISHALPLLIATAFMRTSARNPILLPLVQRMSVGEGSVHDLLQCLWEVIISPRAGCPKLVKLVLSRGELRPLRSVLRMFLASLGIMSYSSLDLAAVRSANSELAIRVQRSGPYSH